MLRFLKFFSKEKLPVLSRHLSPRDYESLMPTADGFPRPDWPLITQKIETDHAERLDEAWQDLAHIWLTRLKHRLEGQYRVDRSKEFILLSALPQRRAGFLLEILEGIRKRILDNLGWGKEDEDPGLYTVLLFADLATYQLYASGLGPEGEEAPSIGQYVSGLYTYLAVVEQENWRMEPTLAYLLAHSILDGNSLPLWLEKGLCRHFRDLYDQGDHLNHAFQTRAHWESPKTMVEQARSARLLVGSGLRSGRQRGGCGTASADSISGRVRGGKGCSRSAPAGDLARCRVCRSGELHGKKLGRLHQRIPWPG